MRNLTFETTVKGQKGFILIGKITSKKLVPFIKHKVLVTVEVVKE